MDPIRCFTCGRVIGNLWSKYRSLCQTMTPEKAMDELGLKRYCCRAVVLTSVNVTEKVLDYNAVHVQRDNPFVKYKTKTVPGNARTYLAR